MPSSTCDGPGRWCASGRRRGRHPLPLLPDDFIARGIRVVGTSTGTLADTREALEFVANGAVKPRVEERRLEDVEQALEDLEAGRVEGRIVLRIQPSLAGAAAERPALARTKL